VPGAVALSVKQVAEPHQSTGQMDEAQVVATGLFVAGRQPTASLEAVKQAFDAIPDAVQLLVQPAPSRPGGMRRDHHLHSASASQCPNSFGVVARVADEDAAVGVFDQRRRDGRFVGLARCQLDVDWTSLGVRKRMDFRRESTT
jgi:hypothetical protein